MGLLRVCRKEHGFDSACYETQQPLASAIADRIPNRQLAAVTLSSSQGTNPLHKDIQSPKRVQVQNPQNPPNQIRSGQVVYTPTTQTIPNQACHLGRRVELLPELGCPTTCCIWPKALGLPRGSHAKLLISASHLSGLRKVCCKELFHQRACANRRVMQVFVRAKIHSSFPTANLARGSCLRNTMLSLRPLFPKSHTHTCARTHVRACICKAQPRFCRASKPH